ncbi:N-acetyl-gamma-glutamyl-phosphate reductase [Bacillus solimangrovi]|uniref:N-acetyl-gamma-glutamyl-phosphate reductase n=1 Tax=Bacillus solimangrovi TaxID=1305675 RepID=A0A1E5LC27_9BACI|nr:N-acetyl-gamma-glutamyl-phosphate reductase [Bacillus solimangrovi]OEH91645.1 N-acetyl-gamma-glutamyl-phosphate reductase [Bacillus solimangrovi]
MRAAIIGATGYGGAELVRILHSHPKCEVVSVHSSSQSGIEYKNSYMHTQDRTPFVLESIDAYEIAKKADIVFMATPAGISSKLTPEMVDAGLKVIDLSGDLRIKNLQDYEKWYKKAAAPKSVVEEAVYGLSEWSKESVRTAKVVANPGCYPTATLLGIVPLVNKDLIKLSTLIIDAKSAVSGAGRSPSEVTHFPEMNDNFRIYKVNQHQHIPEIEQMLTSWSEEKTPISFNTHLVPMTRGIMATMYAQLKNAENSESIHDLYNEIYEDSPFVRIRPLGTFPSTKEVYGSNFCDIGLSYDERTNRVIVVSVIDNLMKGAAGQAVQNLNIMMGIEETTGLDFIPVYP